MDSHGSLPWGIKEINLSINEPFLLPQIQTHNNREQQQLILFSNFQTNNKQQEMERTYDVIYPYVSVMNEMDVLILTDRG
jgi:hypothetical protein